MGVFACLLSLFPFLFFAQSHIYISFYAFSIPCFLVSKSSFTMGQFFLIKRSTTDPTDIENKNSLRQKLTFTKGQAHDNVKKGRVERVAPYRPTITWQPGNPASFVSREWPSFNRLLGWIPLAMSLACSSFLIVSYPERNVERKR